VPATPPKAGSVAGPESGAAAAVSDTYEALCHWALATRLRGAGNRAAHIVAADPKVFHSAIRQAARPGEKAVHVKAFRGSKDGFLFFLPTGILWGFKKPLLFVPLERVVAVSYTSVLQRTFNIVVEIELGGGEENAEIEFAMLDQEDYGGIDESYVRRHGLQDRSMAEARKAKREMVEGRKKGAEAEGGEEAGDGMSELQRAEMELQDEEDEEEEDYDPGSDGESEGSGSDDDEEDGEGDGDEDEDEEDEEDEDNEE
jgi:hypothetical protein